MRRQFTFGKTLLAGIFLLGAAVHQTASAQGAQQYGGTGGVHRTWSPTAPPLPAGTVIDVTYFIGAGFNPPQENTIRAAAAAWNAAGAGRINLIEVGTAAAAGIDIVQANQVPLFNISATFVPGAGLFPDGVAWERITGVTITIDSNPSSPLGTGSPVGGGQFDFLAVMIDLFGLSLGLGVAGAGDPNSVMVPNFGVGPQNQALSAQDINALASLYGAPEPATWTLFGVGLLAMGAWRRRKSAKPI